MMTCMLTDPCPLGTGCLQLIIDIDGGLPEWRPLLSREGALFCFPVHSYDHLMSHKIWGNDLCCEHISLFNSWDLDNIEAAI